MLKNMKLGLGMLVLGLLVGGAYAAVAQGPSPMSGSSPPAACTDEDRNEVDDGPDQGPDANATEAGHQDASDAGDAPEADDAGACEAETEDDSGDAETDGVDHEFEGEEEHTD